MWLLLALPKGFWIELLGKEKEDCEFLSKNQIVSRLRSQKVKHIENNRNRCWAVPRLCTPCCRGDLPVPPSHPGTYLCQFLAVLIWKVLLCFYENSIISTPRSTALLTLNTLPFVQMCFPSVKESSTFFQRILQSCCDPKPLTTCCTSQGWKDLILPVIKEKQTWDDFLSEIGKDQKHLWNLC